MVTCVVIKLLMLVSRVLTARVPNYDTYPLESLCGMYQDKQTISLKSRPAVISLTSRIVKKMKCHLELRLPSESFGFSVFIESMRIENTTGCSKDFLQFGRYNNTMLLFCIFLFIYFRDFLIFTSYKSDKRCGTFEAPKQIFNNDGTLLSIDSGETSLKEREYLEAEDDEMDIWMVIHPSEPQQQTKHLRLIVTPFKKVCSKSDYLYKQCPSNKKCIKRELFCDGIINCDGEEKEEKDEYCLKESVLPGSGMFMSIPVIIIIVIVSLVVIMGTIVLCKVAREYYKLVIIRSEGPPARTPPTITRSNTTRTPSSSVLQRDITEHHITPSAPIMSTGEAHPYLSPLPPSYNEVMGIGFKEDPPKYSEFPET